MTGVRTFARRIGERGAARAQPGPASAIFVSAPRSIAVFGTLADEPGRFAQAITATTVQSETIKTLMM
jgi:hypothetical protein